MIFLINSIAITIIVVIAGVYGKVTEVFIMIQLIAYLLGYVAQQLYEIKQKLK